jgi:hypothetical protein
MIAINVNQIKIVLKKVIEMNGKRLFILSIIFFILFDMISTIWALNYLGSYEYESSYILRNSFENFGLIGFIIIKFIIASIVLWIAYKLEFNYILIGTIIGGIYVGISNCMIPLTGHSLYIFNLDSQIIGICLIVIPCLIQILKQMFKFNKEGLTEYEENIIDFNMIKYQEVLKELEK